MEVSDRFQSLFDNKYRVPLSKPSALANPLKQFPTGSQFCHDIKVSGTLEPFEEFDDMRMTKAAEEFHFFIDHVLVAFDVLLRDDFYGYWAIGPLCFLYNAVSKTRQLGSNVKGTFRPLNQSQQA